MTHNKQAVPVDCRACKHVRDVVEGKSAGCVYGPGQTPGISRNWRLITSGPACPGFEPSEVVSVAPLFMGAPK